MAFWASRTTASPDFRQRSSKSAPALAYTPSRGCHAVFAAALSCSNFARFSAVTSRCICLIFSRAIDDLPLRVLELAIERLSLQHGFVVDLLQQDHFAEAAG